MDLTPWAYAQPCAVTLLSCVVALYVVFSPIGLAGDGSNLFVPVLLGLLGLNVAFWFGWHRRLTAGWESAHDKVPSSPLVGTTAERVAALTSREPLPVE